MTRQGTTRGLLLRKGIWHIEGEASFASWNAVDPSMGRSHAIDGQPGKVALGLRGAWVSRTSANDRTWMSGLDRSEAGAEASRRSAMLRAKLSALSLSCFARKARDLPSWQIPFVVYDSPCFARSRKQMLRFTVVRNTYSKSLSSTSYRVIP